MPVSYLFHLSTSFHPIFYLFPTEIKKIMFPFIDALHFFPVPNNISQKVKKKPQIQPLVKKKSIIHTPTSQPKPKTRVYLLSERFRGEQKNASYSVDDSFDLSCQSFLKKQSVMSFGAQTPSFRPTVHFCVRRKVQFGQALYVVGSTPELGEWNVQHAYKLSWKQGHLWNADIHFSQHSRFVQWKYVVAPWQHATNETAEWEAGTHNRSLTLSGLSSPIILGMLWRLWIENVWNIDHITLYLLVPRHKYENEKYFVSVGGRKQGQWDGPKQMLESNSGCSPEDGNGKRWKSGLEKFHMFTRTLKVNRGGKKLQYCYYQQKQNHAKMSKQRVPIRKFDIQQQRSLDPRCRRVERVDGKVVLFENCNFEHLVYSQIDDDIFIGPYLRDCSDMEKLKEEGVGAVLAIQSPQDHTSHQISSHYLQLLCTQYAITYKTYSILDANAVDFIQKCLGAVKSLIKLIKHEQKKVYIHCSAGMFRSPQIVTLYLVIEKRMELNEAISLVRKKHKYAQPSTKVLNTVVRKLVGQAY